MNLRLTKGRLAHHCLLEGKAHRAASAGTSWLIWEGLQVLAAAHEEINAVDTPSLGLLCGYRPNPWIEHLEHY